MQIPITGPDFEEFREKFRSFSEAEKKRFNNLVENVLYDRHWCLCNEINYENPDSGNAAVKLYQTLKRENDLPKFLSSPVPQSEACTELRCRTGF